MSSNGRSQEKTLLELSAPSAAEVAALSAASGPRQLPPEEYRALLEACAASYEELRARAGPMGERFRL